MTKYITVPMTVDAIQFTGTHESGMEIIEAFPDEMIELQYDYGRIIFNLKVLNPRDSRYYVVRPTDYVVKGALGELFIHRENLFQAMFTEIVGKV